MEFAVRWPTIFLRWKVTQNPQLLKGGGAEANPIGTRIFEAFQEFSCCQGGGQRATEWIMHAR